MEEAHLLQQGYVIGAEVLQKGAHVRGRSPVQRRTGAQQLEGFGTPLHDDGFFENPDNPGEELGNRLDPEADTGHSGYFTDEETLSYLGEVLTGGAPQ